MRVLILAGAAALLLLPAMPAAQAYGAAHAAKAAATADFSAATKKVVKKKVAKKVTKTKAPKVEYMRAAPM